jgi:hypothetical protein
MRKHWKVNQEEGADIYEYLKSNKDINPKDIIEVITGNQMGPEKYEVIEDTNGELTLNPWEPEETNYDEDDKYDNYNISDEELTGGKRKRHKKRKSRKHKKSRKSRKSRKNRRSRRSRRY